MVPPKFSRLVYWSSRSLRFYCINRKIPNFNNKKTLIRLCPTNPPALAISIFQRHNISYNKNFVKSGDITSNNSNDTSSISSSSDKSKKGEEEEKKSSNISENQAITTTNLVELIDKFEDAILKDLDNYKSLYPKKKQQHSTNEEDIIDKFLCTPTWSTRDEYGPPPQKNTIDSLDSLNPISISDEEIQRLLRLSALPPPNDSHQLQILREDLKSQLAFVRKVQSVDTEGVEPLVCVRDETTAGLRDSTITLDDLKDALSKEYQTGKCQRPRKRETHVVNEDIKWDVFANSENVIEMNGEKYFIVKQRGSASSSEIKEEIDT
ncbi:putative duf726 domain-containing protein [Erysiphe neolycopersici]|uniref:Putative duf726 domain-containing protein n=1 Tax=Erysiphe neolycopersici TaxID=212602 RepID=A0A420HYB0_9PEZI|nr:putative duf726 domain-containing protein [Erysiphe neolycopersici]